MLVAPTGAPAAPVETRAHADRALATEILRELNAFRLRHGRAPLRSSRGLATAAASHSQAMARLGFFTHESHDGSPFWKRVHRSYPVAGFRGWIVGENLLWATTVTASRAVAAWARSPGHRANMLSRRWREIGISAVRASAAPGVYGGRDVTIVTTDFGVRR